MMETRDHTLLGRQPILKIKQRNRVTCIALTNRYVVTGGSSDGEIAFFDKSDGSILEVTTDHTDTVNCLWVAFSILWSGSSDCSVRVWDLGLISCLGKYKCPSAVVAFQEGPAVMCVATEGKDIIVFKPKVTNGNLVIHTRLAGHKGPVTCLSWFNKLWSVSSDKTIRTWSPQGKKALSVHEMGVDGVVSIVVPNNREIFLGTQAGTIVVLNHMAVMMRTLGGHAHQQAVKSMVAFDPKGILISASKDNTIKVWNTRKYELLETLPNHDKPVNVVQLSGSFMLSGSSDKLVMVWNFSEFLGHLSVEDTEGKYEKCTEAQPTKACCLM
eukprot:Sspe_Gene.73948::Locus_45220_Transcript_2_10_Confidence_0.125_Length_1278::g.73948::m.73948